MDDEFLDAIGKTADTSFDATLPTNSPGNAITCPVVLNLLTGEPIKCPVVLHVLAKPVFAVRRSGIATTGFLDGEYKSTDREVRPQYLGPPSGRIPTADEKRGAWQLFEEYLAGRLGKNEEENGRLWNTVKWVDRHLRIASMPVEAVKGSTVIADGGEEIASHIEDPDDLSPKFHPAMGRVAVTFEPIGLGEATGRGAEPSV